MRNQRKLCDEIEAKLGIKATEEWGKVTTLKFIEMGGRIVLAQHGFSLYDALVEIYPGLFHSPKIGVTSRQGMEIRVV